MEKCLESLQTKIKCRTREITTLYSLLAYPSSTPQSIFILGHTGTGKSLVVRSVLEHLCYNFCFIDCIENPTTKNLLERIVHDLSRTKTEKPDKPKCQNVFELVSHLRQIDVYTKRRMAIVLKHCHRLRDFEDTLLPSLSSLRELSGTDICTIFISDVVWEKFRTRNDQLEPVKVTFPQYSQENIAQILMLLEKDNPEFNSSLYEFYLSLFLPVYYRFCRDLRELQYMAQLNFEKFLEPIRTGQCDKSDHRFLWRHIGPIFKSNLEVIYLRIPADELATRQRLVKDMNSTVKLVDSFELPTFSKYMLIAAFLASYVPPKLDKQLFRTQAGKKKRKKKNTTKKQDLMTASPQAFGLYRMLSIFCAIWNDDVDVNAILLSQISTLCRLGLITPVGLNKLDEPKYKCCIDFEFVQTIAGIVKFELYHYLDVL